MKGLDFTPHGKRCTAKALMLFAFGAFLSVLPAFGEETVKITDALDYLNIDTQTEFFTDATSDLSFSEIQALPDSSFTQMEKKHYGLGLLKDILWIRFRVEKTGHKDALLSVTKLYPYSDLYIPCTTTEGIEYRRYQAGNFINEPKRERPYRYPVVKIPVNASPIDYFYLRIQPFSPHDHMVVNFTVQLESEQHFYTNSVRELTLFILLIGALITLGIYNLFLAVSMKSRLYGVYVSYLAFLLIYTILRSRIPAIFEVYSVHVFVLPTITITYVLAIAFSRSFLDSGRNLPRFDKAILAVVAVCALVIVSLVAGKPVMANRLLHLLAIANPVVLIAAGLLRLAQGYKPARFYLIAWAGWGFASVVIGSGGLGFITSPVQLELAVGFGGVWEALLISLALADRINVLRMEKELLADREKTLIEITEKDELTGLYNKRKYLHSIREIITESRERAAPLSLMIIDIDHFKSVNDEYGHLVGDSFLRHMGHFIQHEIRNKDSAYRYGGEEFVVILRETVLIDAVSIAERLRKDFAQAACVAAPDLQIKKTLSVGVTELAADDDPESVFKRMDRFLYVAKQNGRNNVVCGETDQPSKPLAKKSPATNAAEVG